MQDVYKRQQYDRIIIGGGLYGLYSALHCGSRGERVIVLEYDDAPFKRATYINQARVHMGYHYPRSYSTAIKSAHYFERFCRDYGFCILTDFSQVYATSAEFSWTNASQFKRFCRAANIRCDEVPTEQYFKPGMCDGAFLTQEYTYDAQILKKYFLDKLAQLPNVKLVFCVRIQDIHQEEKYYTITLDDGSTLKSAFVLNASYASVNQILYKLGLEPFQIKYELCEKMCIRDSPKEAIQIAWGISARVDQKKCVGCGKCAKVCPAAVIEIVERGTALQ